MVKDQNWILSLKPPYNILHFINILLSPNICTFWDMEIFLHPHPIFLHFQIWTFWPQEPKNSNLINSFLVPYPQPKMNQKSPKDPKSILILTMKLLYTYFWKMLPIGALIWLALIWLIWAQIAQPTSNHLKTQAAQSFRTSWIPLCNGGFVKRSPMRGLLRLAPLSQFWVNTSARTQHVWANKSQNNEFHFCSRMQNLHAFTLWSCWTRDCAAN